MKYTLKTIKYVFKNFLFLFPLALIPAIGFAFMIDNESLSEFLSKFFTGKTQFSFEDIFFSVSLFNSRSFRVILLGIASFVAIVLCVSLLMALVEKHMRIGKRTFRSLLPKLNDNLISTAGMSLFFFVLYEVWTLILSALLYLMTFISNVIVSYIFICITFIGMSFLFIWILAIFYLWLPCLQITGFRPMEALNYSYSLLMPKKVGLVFGMLISMLAVEVLLSLVALFISSTVVTFVLDVVIYSFAIMTFCVRMHVAFFERSQSDETEI